MLYSTVNTYFSEIFIQLSFYPSSLPITHQLFMKHPLRVKCYVWVEGTKVKKDSLGLPEHHTQHVQKPSHSSVTSGTPPGATPGPEREASGEAF